MATQISPLALRIQVAGSREGQNEVRRFAGSFDFATQKASETSKAVKEISGRDLTMAVRQAQRLQGGLDDTAKSAGDAQKGVRGIATELDAIDKKVHSTVNRFKEMGQHVKEAAGHIHQVWSIVSALHSGGPLKLFDAVLPDSVKKKIGGGMVAGGVGLSALLASTVSPASTKQSQMTAITALADNNAGAAADIYKTTDEASVASVFNLPQLVDASKTLTKDRQFSSRYLKASDDLAATDPEQFNPQDVARALGRIRVGDTGEGLERLGDMGLNKQDLKDKGIEFDGSGAIADKSVAGIDKLMEAIVKTIEERFGGLSEKLATTTLQGAVSNMQDAIGRFATSIGETFIPALTWGANTIKAVATWFAELPGPIKQVIAWGGLLGAGLLVLGGGFILVAGTISKIVFAWKALQFVLGLFGTSIGQLSMQLLTQMLPSIATIGLAIGLLAIAAVGFYTMIAGYQDASSQSAAQLQEHWGALGRWWVWAGDMLTKFWNHPLIKAVLDPFNLTGIRNTTDSESGDAAEKESKRIDDAQRAKRGLGPSSYNQSGHENDDEYVSQPKAPPGGNLTNLQGQWDASRQKAINANALNTNLSTPGMPAISGPMMVGAATAQLNSQQSIDVQMAQSTVDSLEREIQGLQDQKRNADKDQKKVLAQQIAEKQRQLQAARRELSAQKKLSAQGEKEANQLEKQQEAEAGYAADLASTRSELAFNEHIDDLQLQLDKAREDADAAKVQALTEQIEIEKAKQNLAQKRGEAAKVALADEKKADFMEADAQLRYNDAIKRAKAAGQRAGERADGKKKSLSPAEVRAIFNATGATMAGGDVVNALNPGANSGNRFEGLDGIAPPQLGSNLVKGVPSVGGFDRRNDESLRKERRIRVQQMQKADGTRVVKFKVDDLEIPYAGLAGMEVD